MSKEKFTAEELNINKELEAAGFEPIGPSEEVVAEKEPSRGLPEGFDPNSMSFNIETPDNSVSPTPTHDNEGYLDAVKGKLVAKSKPDTQTKTENTKVVTAKKIDKKLIKNLVMTITPDNLPDF